MHGLPLFGVTLSFRIRGPLSSPHYPILGSGNPMQ